MIFFLYLQVAFGIIGKEQMFSNIVQKYEITWNREMKSEIRKMDKYYRSEFVALLNEASFTKDILGIGVTQLYKANYAKIGTYYQAFTCLSTGVERIGKLCLILDSYIEDKGKFPDENYIRKHGHRITGLYESCREIAGNRKFGFAFPCVLQDSIHQAMINILHAFAQSSGRYHNINMIAGKNFDNDCVKRWKEEVDVPLYQKCVSKRKKEKIKKTAEAAEMMLGDVTLVNYISEEGNEIREIEAASRETGIWAAAAPYRQLYMLQIIRFFVQVLFGLEGEARKVSQEEPMIIPYFGEVFGIFFNSDAYFRSRKTWDI